MKFTAIYIGIIVLGGLIITRTGFGPSDSYCNQIENTIRYTRMCVASPHCLLTRSEYEEFKKAQKLQEKCKGYEEYNQEFDPLAPPKSKT